jgi:hypothetical protein
MEELTKEERKRQKWERKYLKKISGISGGFWKDFKGFISRGNIVQLAVAFILGGAFGRRAKN